MNRQTNKILSWLLTACMIFAMLPAAVSASGGELTGSGTADDPYLIGDAPDLAAFRDLVNAQESSEACAKLTADIELTGGWTPIYPTSGYITDAYKGTFDGDFHTIKGLNINSTESNQGFFGGINGATIKNLKVEGSVTSSNNYVGGIVGKLQQGTVENCSFTGSVTTTKSDSSAYAGGIAGYTGTSQTQTGRILNCSNASTVTGGCIGGITSYAKYSEITGCYNVGTITGTGHTGGIAGQIINSTVISNCYSTGEVTSSGNAGGIAGFNNLAESIKNCYWTTPDDCFKSGTGTGSAVDSEKIASPDGLAGKLGEPFIEDSDNINNGYPILRWQKEEEATPKNPHITITGSAVLRMENNGTTPQTTLSVNYTDMDAVPVTWEKDSDIITLEAPEEADENNSRVIVKAQRPGKAVVTASAANGEYTAQLEITVMPYITTVEIDGDVTAGKTVRARVFVLGGSEYDYENYPELAFQWKYLAAEDYLSGNTYSASYHNIEGAAEREFTIPNELAGDYLSFEFYYNGEYKTPSSPQKIHAASYKQLLSDRDDLSIATDDIKENTVIDLPGGGENGSVITWESSHPDIIDENGNVTLPEEETTEVTLTATLSLDGETAVKTFKITVYSKKAIEDEKHALSHQQLLSDCDDLSIATDDIKENTVIDLPGEGENGSVITWKSSHPDIIDENGNVTLPEDETTEVTLTATLSLDGETAVKTFKITVYSKKAVEDEKHAPSYKQLLSDRDDLSIATDDIKENTVIDLPGGGENGSVITWESSHPDIIDENGNVTLPEEETTEVTLTATLSLDGETAVKTFKITVYSKKAIEDEKHAAQYELDLNKLHEIEAALGDYYKITPVFGTDTNIVDIIKADILEKSGDYSDCTVSLSAVETVYSGADIAENGDITYFYADPNTTPSIKMGSFRASFALSVGEAEITLTVPVIVYWDRDKVKETMRSEILDSVTEASILGGNTAAGHITEDLVLPKAADDKKWTLISWQSSDNDVISISNENQGTADTLFSPYVGKIRRGAEDKAVTLTAIFTFQLTNDTTGGEAPITMSKTFDVLVKAIGTEQIEAIRADLNEKLDKGFGAAGIKDAVTGAALEYENGAYTAYNDIQLPTTRDFGVDGKYYPVTLSSDNNDVIKAPDVNNAARLEVYRPAVGSADADTVVTVTITDTGSNISVSRSFRIIVPALTAAEVDAEKALMRRVKAAYFDGIRGDNEDAGDISANLSPFLEVYEDNGALVWVRGNAERQNRGIIAEPIEGWEELEVWRLFRSSNPAAVTHENLLVTQQKNAKAVTIDSVLSSEQLGRYGALYKSDPVKYAAYKELAELYYQPVSADLVVRGTSTPIDVRPMAVEETVDVSFRLQSSDGILIDTVNYSDLKEGTTVFDIFKKVMEENGYAYKRHGSYVYSVTTPDGTEIKELDEGENSGWLYKVNGEIPNMQMAAYGLHDGDSIVMFFSKDFTEDTGYDRPTATPHVTGGSGGASGAKPKPATGAEPSQKPAESAAPSPKPAESAAPVSTPNASASPALSGGFQITQKIPYSDVKEDWAAEAIAFVTEKNLMRGVEDGKFGPGLPITRAMLVTVLYRMAGEPETADGGAFADVEKESYYAKAVAWANANGIANGITETEFAPEENITREQIAALMYRYAQYKGYDISIGGETNIMSYSDADEISEYAAAAMRYMSGSGLMTGRTEKTLNPRDTATRAEFAVILHRFAGTEE